MSIKKLLILSAVAVVSTAALAGGPDAMSGPMPAAPASVMSDWTGIYAGANIGGAIGTAPTSTVVGGDVIPIVDEAGYNTVNNNNLNASSAIGGMQLGYNYEIQDFVPGLETNFDYMGQNTSTVHATQITGGTALAFTGTNSIQTNWDYTLRGKLGYSFNDDTLMVYGTGGLALADLTYTTATTVDGLALHGPHSLGQTMIGWTAGGGLEWRFVPNWSLQGQYLYENLGTASQSNSYNEPFTYAGQINVAQNASLTENVVTAAINYHF